MRLLSFFADRLKVQLREQGARHDLVDAVFALGQIATLTRTRRPRGRCPLPLAGEGRGEGSPADPSAASVGAPRPVLNPSPCPSPARGEGDATDAVALDDERRANVQDDLLLIVRRIEALGQFLDTDDGKSLLVGYRRATNILSDEEKKRGKSFAGEIDPQLLIEPEEQTLFEAIGAAEGEAEAAIEREDFDRAMAALARLRAPVDAFFDKVLVNTPDATLRANRLRLLNRIRQATLAVADFSKIAGS